MTKQERKLWYCFLRTYPVKFRRQAVILDYILDFYCNGAELAIELDGSQHYTDEGKEYDTQRTEELNKEGIRVIRFSNKEINEHFDEVCEAINAAVNERKGK